MFAKMNFSKFVPVVAKFFSKGEGEGENFQKLQNSFVSIIIGCGKKVEGGCPQCKSLDNFYCFDGGSDSVSKGGGDEERTDHFFHFCFNCGYVEYGADVNFFDYNLQEDLEPTISCPMCKRT